MNGEEKDKIEGVGSPYKKSVRSSVQLIREQG